MLNRYRLLWRNALAAAAVAACALALPAPARGATMYYLDVPALVEQSDFVVVGELVDARVFEGDEGRITTEWTIRVDVAVLGPASPTLTFRQWAGQLDGTVQYVPGDARLTLGDRMVFFLRGDGGERTYLTALSQSVFRIAHSLAPGGGIVDLPAPASDLLSGDHVPRVGALPSYLPVSRDFDEVTLLLQTEDGPREYVARREITTLGQLIADVRSAAEGR